MKAIAVFPGKRKVELIEHDLPRLERSTQVKIRMLEIGICGTDREICAFEYGTPPKGSEYLVIGHESLGEVVELGQDVKELKEGDLVVTMVRRPCLHKNCLACRSDRQDFCYTGDFRECGIKEEHGFMTEFVVDEGKYMFKVPRELRNVAVLVEPLTIAEKALTQIWDVQERLPWTTSGKEIGKGRKAVVLGAGPVGLLGAMTLLNAGFETYVYSRGSLTSPKAVLTHSIGAKYISAESDSLEDLDRQVGNIDVVYEAVGASQLAFDVMKVLGVNGILAFTGVPGRKAPIRVDADLIMRNLVLKNQAVFGTVNAGHVAHEAAIRDLALFKEKWPRALQSMITGRFSIHDFRDLLLKPSSGIKNIITFE